MYGVTIIGIATPEHYTRECMEGYALLSRAGCSSGRAVMPDRPETSCPNNDSSSKHKSHHPIIEFRAFRAFSSWLLRDPHIITPQPLA